MPDMSYPSWRQRLVRSLHVNRSQAQSKFYQVASVSEQGFPKNRTMVFRGFATESLSLLSITDTRSEKMRDWSASNGQGNRAEVCWYFAGSREQYRIFSYVTLVTKTNMQSLSDEGHCHHDIAPRLASSFLQEQWDKLSTAAKQQFYAETPGVPFDALENSAYANETSKASLNSNNDNSSNVQSTFEINDNFCVVIFTPISVDYLNLKPTPHLRCLSDSETDWLEVKVHA